MALNENRAWLIAYDIACPRRLNRVHRLLKSEAVPLQYSLFIARNTALGIQRLCDRLAVLINPAKDDVRIYQLPADSDVHCMGKQLLPEGIMLMAKELPSPLFRRHPACLREGSPQPMPENLQPHAQPTEKEEELD